MSSRYYVNCYSRTAHRTLPGLSWIPFDRINQSFSKYNSGWMYRNDFRTNLYYSYLEFQILEASKTICFVLSWISQIHISYPKLMCSPLLQLALQPNYLIILMKHDNQTASFRPIHTSCLIPFDNYFLDNPI